MAHETLAPALVAALAATRAHPGLKFLVLHGSRARGDAHETSDWDFAYLAAPALDAALLHADLIMALGTDRVDLVDLAGASGLFRYRVARDGVVLVEPELGAFQRFWFDAVSFWCDAEPILRRGYDQILEELGP